jgi:hypothetical protein
MKAVIVIVLPTREVPPEKVQPVSEIAVLPIANDAPHDDRMPEGFWTWFIENPRLRPTAGLLA